ncbi:MAG: ribonuclease H-like domain-containing protein [bacterium]|nr:ribonuclease H-like domain-containing protein [bacterium]
MLDTVVLDIETKNTFGDVGGKEHLTKLEISVACFYSVNKNKHFCFDENQFEEMKQFLSQRAILVGFSSNKFDIPILQHTLDMDLMSYPRLDISDEIEIRTGRLVGLNDLANHNLGTEKTGTGLNAPVLYREGKMDELKEYCRQDVEITARLFEKIKKEGQLIIPPRKTDAIGENEIIEIDISQTLNQLN